MGIKQKLFLLYTQRTSNIGTSSLLLLEKGWVGKIKTKFDMRTRYITY